MIRWNFAGRAIVFLLASSSIACLLVEFYGLCPMRGFTLAVFLPCIVLLAFLALHSGLRGDRRVASTIVLSALAGLFAAIAYDVFRLPFVFSREWGLASLVPPLNLFKVFPRFGAMILGQPMEQPAYSPAAQLVGWAYHFSNGAAFGVMYVALTGRTDRSTLWAVLFATGLEIAMLLTPYPAVFGIKVTVAFIGATLSAHLIFGLFLGLSMHRLGRRAELSPVLTTA